ncbi:MAG TPA: class I SAM-dependent methyltransferase [Polyangiaceae bacterium]
MLPRVLEPEVMDTAQEAADYDAMDNREPNERFATDCLHFARFANALDVGTGTALIPIAMCERAPDVRFVAVDLAEHMLALAKRNVARAGLGARIELQRVDAKRLPFADGAFETVVSNSIVHHVPDPAHALGEMNRVARRVLFVRDLFRPESDAEVARLVALHGGAPPAEPAALERHARQVALLDASLRAALTIDEVRDLVRSIGIPPTAVSQTSDRHFTLAYEKK